MRPAAPLALLVALTFPVAAWAGPASSAPAAPPATPAGPVRLAALEHGARSERRVALTFDACTTTREPSPYDPRIPALLDELRAPATIFVGGGWAEREPEALGRLAGDPLLELGNHTYSHPHLTRLSDERVRDELLRTQALVAARTGRAPALFRPPYGEYDARVVRVAAALGLRTVEYDLPSGDPDPRATAPALARWVVSQARPGSIVVMHLNHPRFPTAEALPEIVRGLRARGFELVKVSELAAPVRAPPGVAARAARPPSRPSAA